MTARRCASIALIAIALCCSCTRPKETPGVFLVPPYLQLGSAYSGARAAGTASIALLWHAADDAGPWAVEIRDGNSWKPTAAPSAHRVTVSGIAPHNVWQASLSGLDPGQEFDYHLLRAGQTVFSARGKAPKRQDQKWRFVAFGDSGDATPAERAVAAETRALDPDLVFIAGDIVYENGRVIEYRSKFFPYYNSTDAPLMSRVPFVAAPGNHDTLNRNLFQIPDSLAYFYYWSQPLNGPLDASFAGLSGSASAQMAFRAAAGDNFPRMANFSFDYGNAHWLVLDSNPYANWRADALRQWIARDLGSAKTAWKFVGFHHAPFHSSVSHEEDTWMRALSDVFQSGGVDVVIAGHVHNYERSRPLTFTAGKWTLDKSFDGTTTTAAHGIVYLVTGGGGADLYDPQQNDRPSAWQEFTVKFKSSAHSLTVADIDGRTARFRQVSEKGEELDAFTLTK
jgi:predicted phosphodiesterase